MTACSAVDGAEAGVGAGGGEMEFPVAGEAAAAGAEVGELEFPVSLEAAAASRAIPCACESMILLYCE